MVTKTLKKELDKKVTAVWMIQGNNRFLLNYFYEFDTARAYVKGLKHFKINGELLIGEITLKYLVG